MRFDLPAVQVDVVGLEGAPLAHRSRGDQPGPVVVGREGDRLAVGREEHLDRPVPRAGPEGVVRALAGRADAVGAGADGAGDEGLLAVGSDDDGGALLERRAVAGRAAHADHPSALPHELGHANAEAHLGAGGGSRAREQRVEHAMVGDVHRVDSSCGFDGLVDARLTGVHDHRPNGRAARCHQRVEQTPPLEVERPGCDHVAGGRHPPARERGPIEHEHLPAAASQLDGGGRTGAPGADDDGVVLRCVPRLHTPEA
jgi:hypothetical protein